MVEGTDLLKVFELVGIIQEEIFLFVSVDKGIWTVGLRGIQTI